MGGGLGLGIWLGINRVRDRDRGINRVRNWDRVRGGGERVRKKLTSKIIKLTETKN